MMLVRFVKSPNVWTASFLYIAFYAVAEVLSYRDLNVSLQCLSLGISVTVLVAYWQPAFESLLKPRIDRDDHLVLGIAVAWLGLALRSSFIIAWRTGFITDTPHSQITSDWLNFFTFMIITGAALHVTAPGTLNGVVPRRNWLTLAIGVGAGVGLAALLIVLGTDV